MNETCLSLQGKVVNIFQAQDKIVSLSSKLQYWISDMEQNTHHCFPLLSDFLQESEVDLEDEILNDIENHLNSLSESLIEYFPNLKNNDNYWVYNPFKAKEKPTGFPTVDYENCKKLLQIFSYLRLSLKKFQQLFPGEI